MMQKTRMPSTERRSSLRKQPKKKDLKRLKRRLDSVAKRKEKRLIGDLPMPRANYKASNKDYKLLQPKSCSLRQPSRKKVRLMPN